MDDQLDIPEFLRIPQEARRAAWANYTPPCIAGQAKPQVNGPNLPGSVCRQAGLPDGIAPDVVERMELLAAAKKAVADARHYAWIERVTAEQAELDAVKKRARTVHKAKRRVGKRRARTY